jgi:hypothetical protein
MQHNAAGQIWKNVEKIYHGLLCLNNQLLCLKNKEFGTKKSVELDTLDTYNVICKLTDSMKMC